MSQANYEKYSEIEYKLKDEIKTINTLTFNQLQIAKIGLEKRRKPTDEHRHQLEGVRFMLKYRSDNDMHELVEYNNNTITSKKKRARCLRQAENTANIIINWLQKYARLGTNKSIKGKSH